MKLQISSDRHHELLKHFEPKKFSSQLIQMMDELNLGSNEQQYDKVSGWETIPVTDADVIVLSGDIDHGERAAHYACEIAREQQKPVVLIAGNHEFYESELPYTLHQMRKICTRSDNVYFLENDSVVINGTRFIGCTLWTDYLKGDPILMENAIRKINDYRYIKSGEPAIYSSPKNVMPQFLLGLHQDSVAYIDDELSNEFAGQTVVVTHHAPCYEALDKEWIDNPYFALDELHKLEEHGMAVGAACYASDLRWLLEKHRDKIDRWIHGHTHKARIYEASGVKMLCNAKGYPPRTTPGFREFSIDV